MFHPERRSLSRSRQEYGRAVTSMNHHRMLYGASLYRFTKTLTMTFVSSLLSFAQPSFSRESWSSTSACKLCCYTVRNRTNTVGTSREWPTWTGFQRLFVNALPHSIRSMAHQGPSRVSEWCSSLQWPVASEHTRWTKCVLDAILKEKPPITNLRPSPKASPSSTEFDYGNMKATSAGKCSFGNR